LLPRVLRRLQLQRQRRDFFPAAKLEVAQRLVCLLLPLFRLGSKKSRY